MITDEQYTTMKAQVDEYERGKKEEKAQEQADFAAKRREWARAAVEGGPYDAVMVDDDGGFTDRYYLNPHRMLVIRTYGKAWVGKHEEWAALEKRIKELYPHEAEWVDEKVGLYD